MGYPGSIEKEEIDANTFAEWGVDSLKLDGKNAKNTLFRAIIIIDEISYIEYHNFMSLIHHLI